MIFFLFIFNIESDVYSGVNITEDSSYSTDSSSTDYTERPIRPHTTTHNTKPTFEGDDRRSTSNHGTSFNDNCNASTPPMRVFPSEVHHYHHHSFGIPTNGGCNSFGGGQFGSQNGGFTASGSTFSGQQETQGGSSAIQQLQHQMKQVMIALENMKLKVATLSEVVDELINSNGNTKLVLTGAQIDSTTNLFEFVRHIISDRLDLKDLKNDVYSATRTKEGIVFDVASGLDKRRILVRARERLNRDDEELRIQDYYEDDAKPDDSSEAERIIDVRFGSDD